jgi:hypothetical protein
MKVHVVISVNHEENQAVIHGVFSESRKEDAERLKKHVPFAEILTSEVDDERYVVRTYVVVLSGSGSIITAERGEFTGTVSQEDGTFKYCLNGTSVEDAAKVAQDIWRRGVR